MRQSNPANDPAAPDVVSVTVRRMQAGSTATGAPTGTWAVVGTPVPARVYRRNYRKRRDELSPGTATVDEETIVSFPGASLGSVLINDLLDIPACRATNDEAITALVTLVRPFPTGLQCDVEIGAEQTDNPAGDGE